MKECAVRSPEQHERTHTDLEFSDYLIYPGSLGEIRAGIESWLREALIAPFSYEGTIKEGRFRAFDQDMVVMAEHGLAERIGGVGQARAEADLAGVDKIHRWLRDEAKDGDLIVLLSPPGTEEEGFGANGERRLSFTQFGQVSVQDASPRIRMISIPEKEISIGNHIGRIEQIWEEPSFVWRSKVARDDRGLVSTPLFIKREHVGDGLEQYARLQGKNGWDQVEEELKNGLALQEDENSLQRRKSLIDTIAWQVRRYIDERDASRLNNIGLVSRVVMAREAAGKYHKWDYKKILEEYSEIESALWFKKKYASKNILNKAGELLTNGAEALQAWKVIKRLQGQLREESDVREMLMGSSCGGGGVEDLMSGKLGMKGNYLDLMARKAAGLQEEESSSESTTTMDCVKCPFCHKTVDAILTPDKIKCPECSAEVSRS
jgi:hypothetical protein